MCEKSISDLPARYCKFYHVFAQDDKICVTRSKFCPDHSTNAARRPVRHLYELF